LPIQASKPGSAGHRAGVAPHLPSEIKEER